MNTCLICLDEYKSPVCIPCGHVFCDSCLNKCAKRTADDSGSAACPSCRAPFTTDEPNLRDIPRNQRRFMNSSVRRIYLPNAHSASSQSPSLVDEVKELKELVQYLKEDNSKLTKRLADAVLAREDAMSRTEDVLGEMQQLKEENATLKASLASFTAVKPSATTCENKQVRNTSVDRNDTDVDMASRSMTREPEEIEASRSIPHEDAVNSRPRTPKRLRTPSPPRNESPYFTPPPRPSRPSHKRRKRRDEGGQDKAESSADESNHPPSTSKPPKQGDARTWPRTLPGVDIPAGKF
ncbi:hypothetical protein K474DRAFT_1699646 [Panus rudis PR-1116 ss-1]|nr:hypothetical protein K474DRAFT_1699646 [Panus rudis PR-1116 ss-1]